jgi:hypothetical protein
MHILFTSSLCVQKAFQGPLHKFGKLMFRRMKNGNVMSDRITREEFVESGTEIVTKANVDEQRKYYFKLFSSGKDHLTRDGVDAHVFLFTIYLFFLMDMCALQNKLLLM